MLLKRFLGVLSLFIFFQCTVVYGQALPVTGRVTSSADMQPLKGANVLVKGSATGVVTNENGEFVITVPGVDAVLEVSFVGYISQEVRLDNNGLVNILLVPVSGSLDDVIVIGYGTAKKRDLTGSVSTVSGKDMDAMPTSSVLSAMSGRAPGVRVMQNTGAPGAATSVRIRGTNSVQGSNEPLYVVDGFPLSGSNPSILDNSNIGSVEILKDASATAIYGSRGANGVVLITTKKGRAGKTSVELESRYTTQYLRKKIDLMNATQYATLYNEVAANDGAAPRFTQEEINAMGNGFDWQDFV